MPDKTTNYGYDDLGRLLGLDFPSGASVDYVYDLAGNRVSVTETPAGAPPPPGITVARLPKAQPGEFPQSPMVVLLSTGDLVGWGDNTTGALSNGLSVATNNPLQKVLFDPNTTMPPSGATIVDLAFTNANLYVVFSNGWVYSAGKNALGQLGHGDTTARPFLRRIEFFVTNSLSVAKVWAADLTDLADASGCVYFQTSNFSVYGCGANAAGNLGNAATPVANVLTPTICAGIGNSPNKVIAVEISGGRNGFSTYMLFDDGALRVAGSNGQGQLGTGATTNVTGSFVNATKLGGTSFVTASLVSAGAGSTNASSGSALVVDTNGNVWTTGRNNFGQLGLGNIVDRTRFEQVQFNGQPLSNIVEAQIGGGFQGYAYALDCAGSLYTWGFNAQNNLFLNNAITPQTAPVLANFVPGGIAKIFLPNGQGLTNSAQMIVLTSDGRIVYAGADNGQGAVASNLSTGAFKLVETPRQILEGRETPIDAYVHGAANLQRLFVLTDQGHLYSCGSNVDSICTGGVASNVLQATTEWFKIDFSRLA